jgi:hypothetical protein
MSQFIKSRPARIKRAGRYKLTRDQQHCRRLVIASAVSVSYYYLSVKKRPLLSNHEEFLNLILDKLNCNNKKIVYLTSSLVLESSSQHASLYRFTSFMYRVQASWASLSSWLRLLFFCTIPVLRTLPPLRLPNAGGGTLFSAAALSAWLFFSCSSCIFLNISINEPSFLNMFSLEPSSSSSSTSSSTLACLSSASGSVLACEWDRRRLRDLRDLRDLCDLESERDLECDLE